MFSVSCRVFFFVDPVCSVCSIRSVCLALPPLLGQWQRLVGFSLVCFLMFCMFARFFLLRQTDCQSKRGFYYKWKGFLCLFGRRTHHGCRNQSLRISVQVTADYKVCSLVFDYVHGVSTMSSCTPLPKKFEAVPRTHYSLICFKFAFSPAKMERSRVSSG